MVQSLSDSGTPLSDNLDKIEVYSVMRRQWRCGYSTPGLTISGNQLSPDQAHSVSELRQALALFLRFTGVSAENRDRRKGGASGVSNLTKSMLQRKVGEVETNATLPGIFQL